MMIMKSLGVVFPGQGSQSVGMLADVARQFPEVENVFNEASTTLGYDLWKLSQQGPAEELDKTTHTQPALFAASYAVWQILRNKKQLQPALLAGHSLGEYTALAAAGAISFTDGIKLVAARGQYMQDAVPAGQGALAAIVGLENDAVAELCKKARQGEEILTPVNFNSPGQVVVGGHSAAVDRAIVLAKEAGARMAKRLAVSVPSHCDLMKPAAERLAELLKTIPIQMPAIPILNNVDVGIYHSPDAIRDGLVRQLYMPVRWVEIIQSFAKAGVSEIIECGPGKVLCGLNKRILADAQLVATSDLVSLQTCLS